MKLHWLKCCCKLFWVNRAHTTICPPTTCWVTALTFLQVLSPTANASLIGSLQWNDFPIWNYSWTKIKSQETANNMCTNTVGTACYVHSSTAETESRLKNKLKSLKIHTPSNSTTLDSSLSISSSSRTPKTNLIQSQGLAKNLVIILHHIHVVY